MFELTGERVIEAELLILQKKQPNEEKYIKCHLEINMQ